MEQGIEQLLAEMTKLNNELVNKQRDLEKKNHEISMLNKRLQDANLELEQFSYAASHDLKEPLRMVNAFMQKLDKEYSAVLDEKAKKYIYFAVDGSKRMTMLVNELLSYALLSNEDSAQEPTDLNIMLKEIISMYKGVIQEKDAVVEVALMPTINAYKTPIKILFQNLISNSLKYVSLVDKPIIKVSASERKDWWEFSVCDNGIGINKDSYEEIFKLFRRLHGSDYAGNGLGLAACRKIVHKHGGQIWVTSEEGLGSTFYFTILK